ncbi:MAG: hypothetical protein M3P11_02055 [Actinomycetota bacterium]|nr:hypothetical protein [Actinomycetota bacterium]
MKRNMLLALALVLVLAACATGGVGDGGDSGVQGVVLAGPQCPVERLDSPCPDRPYPGTVRATGVDGTTAQVDTDDQGRFRLVLAPGTYVVIVVATSGPAPAAVPQTVQVTAGAFTQVTLEVDTGIR